MMWNVSISQLPPNNCNTQSFHNTYYFVRNNHNRYTVNPT